MLKYLIKVASPLKKESVRRAWPKSIRHRYITSLMEGHANRNIAVLVRTGVGAVAPYPNERIKAQRSASVDWLCLVVNCETTPELHPVQFLASALSPEEEVRLRRLAIGPQDRRGAKKRSND
jgi:hypothetical protein